MCTIHACIGCGPFRDLGRCCTYLLCAIEPPHSDVNAVSAPHRTRPQLPAAAVLALRAGYRLVPGAGWTGGLVSAV